MASFRAYEPSESMLLALQARVANKSRNADNGQAPPAAPAFAPVATVAVPDVSTAATCVQSAYMQPSVAVVRTTDTATTPSFTSFGPATSSRANVAEAKFEAEFGDYNRHLPPNLRSAAPASSAMPPTIPAASSPSSGSAASFSAGVPQRRPPMAAVRRDDDHSAAAGAYPSSRGASSSVPPRPDRPASASMRKKDSATPRQGSEPVLRGPSVPVPLDLEKLRPYASGGAVKGSGRSRPASQGCDRDTAVGSRPASAKRPSSSQRDGDEEEFSPSGASQAPAWPGQPAKSAGPRLSAVCVGGVPVATDGDLVYLGGGVYATAASIVEHVEQGKPKPERKESRPRALPGRVKQAPRPPRASVRSSSAGTPVGSMGAQGDLSPCPSRARSDGQSHHDGPPGSARTALSSIMERGSVAGDNKPRAWRPGGVTKLPPGPVMASQIPEPRHGLGPQDVPPGVMPGRHSEALIQAREQMRREDPREPLGRALGLVPEEYEPKVTRVTGPPGHHAAEREARRKAAREEKVRQMNEDRARERQLAGYNCCSPVPEGMRNRMTCSASAPELGAMRPPANSIGRACAPTAEDIEKQKLRVACKMEILNFFDGYSSSLGKISAKQSKVLMGKLHGNCDTQSLEAAVQEADDQSRQLVNEWAEKGMEVVDQQSSIQKRLQQVNDLCNKAFEGGVTVDL
eukprot:gnl/TRDRNA2_/TRDRNA2_182536_c0_seq1.p1 gnl/TRDRNA2_/TRDRNA2_182536_c0~~gnl/TRDRNA2_/TRDRNA2_182536_c0_seq1.p1  ORF type:complete len:686 (-),score=104.61 gnl/TRDRNA2_/TRDRNA2_182536_c0_seq1:66-2123(-)